MGKNRHHSGLVPLNFDLKILQQCLPRRTRELQYANNASVTRTFCPEHRRRAPRPFSPLPCPELCRRAYGGRQAACVEKHFEQARVSLPSGGDVFLYFSFFTFL